MCYLGDRIDVSVRASYCDADRFKAAEMLSDVSTECGLQFVCYTKTGAALIEQALSQSPTVFSGVKASFCYVFMKS